MLYRKIYNKIESHLKSGSDKILVVEGARQVGKSFIIRQVGQACFANYVEVNFAEDAAGPRLFDKVNTTEDFYLTLSMAAGKRLGDKHDTLVFLDEIQQYPQFLTMLKFLRQEERYGYIASGSLLGLSLRDTTSIPVGSVIIQRMYPLDFEEFLLANGVGREAIDAVGAALEQGRSLDEAMHKQMMTLFRRYLLVGGMPDAVNTYLDTHNIMHLRQVHESIRILYADDASKYEHQAGRHLVIKRIYDLVESQMENKKKRIVAKDIRNEKGDRFDRYINEFEYLVSSGITLDVRAVSNPLFPLSNSVHKNLLKLYLNDVGLLTSRLYGTNIRAILDDELGINLGAVYESVVAQELAAHGHRLFYYDNRQRGEVDFMIDDYSRLSVLPIEVKSGKDYRIHSAINNLLAVPDYRIKEGVVLSNSRAVSKVGSVTYLPIYAVMFLGRMDSNMELTF